ncbi:MAG: hypothetical protein ACI841_004246 [Planctomycetota bacterium]|jgi:hypothetical protein
MKADSPKGPSREQRLFELLHDQSDLSAAQRSALEAEFGPDEIEAEREELSAFFSKCKETFDEPGDTSGADSKALVDSILGRTTREDLSWRGDLRLVGNFFSRHWDSSLMVRLVAASLAVHIAALPILALVMILQEDEPQIIKFEAPPDSIFTEADQQESADGDAIDVLDVPQLDESITAQGDDNDLWQEGRASAIAWARFHLRLGMPAADDAATAEAQSDLTRMLQARAEYVTTGAGTLEAPKPEGDVALHVLWVEHLLDRYVLEERVPAGFANALARLDGETEADRVLCAASWARARDYHLLTEDELSDLERDLSDLASGAHSAPALALQEHSTQRSGAPIDALWIQMLRMARGDELQLNATGRAWLAWPEAK